MIAIGVNLIIRVSMVKESYDVLLQEGEFTRVEKKANRKLDPFYGAYWSIVTAYLPWMELLVHALGLYLDYMAGSRCAFWGGYRYIKGCYGIGAEGLKEDRNSFGPTLWGRRSTLTKGEITSIITLSRCFDEERRRE